MMRSESRRKLIKGIPALATALMLRNVSGQMKQKQQCFVLVHGAWHGGWAWKKLARLLRYEGHEVYTPTLTGLGERSHLLNKEIDLNTHIKDIVNVLEYEDLNEVILVGHSYAGMVITGVADISRKRISKLVYLDAFMPEDGKALKDYTPPRPASSEKSDPDSWKVAPRETASQWGVRSEDDITWVNQRLGHQSGATFGQPLKLSSPLDEKLNVSFILLTTNSPWFIEAATRAKLNGYQYFELLTGGHDAMISEPEALSKILNQIAGQ